MDTSKSAAAVAQHSRTDKVHNITVVWLSNHIDEKDEGDRSTIQQLKRIVGDVKTYTNGDQCVQFIRTVTDSKICIVTSDMFGQQVVPLVHELPQVDTILIFSSNKQLYEDWPKQWSKLKGIFTELPSVCEALKQAVQQCEHNIIPISLIAESVINESTAVVDRLPDSSFIYIQVIGEVLSTLDFGEQDVEEFTDYCGDVFADDDDELESIEHFGRDYYSKRPIWWYTQDSFVSRMLNRALRSLNADVIVRMGFFIDDLRRDVQRLHTEQSDDPETEKTTTVYRGQSLSKRNFDRMNQIKGGFISFDDFLLTTKNRQVSLDCVQRVVSSPDEMGVLFVMNLDAAQASTPFASITKVSYSRTDDEVLIATPAVFRIDDIQPIDADSRLYKVTLTLTSDDDADLLRLTDRVREETFADQKGWQRFGQLLLKMNRFDKAQEVYDILLRQAAYDSEKASVYLQLGWIKYNHGDYPAAVSLYEKSLALGQQSLPANHISLASVHTNLSKVYYALANYPQALTSCEKSLEIRQKARPDDHLDLASAYHDLGMVYIGISDYPEALASYESALQIRRQALPPTHLDLATSHNNIGLAHYNMSNYAKALASYAEAFRIQQQSLPANHPDLAIYHNNTGMVYNNMGDFSKALSSYEKALQILQQTLPSDHLNLATAHNNVGMAHFQLGDYSKALASYEKSLHIRQQALPANHSDLGDSYNSMGMVHFNLGNHTKALAAHEKALEIKRKALAPNHHSLGTSYTNIGMVYINMKDYRNALAAHENALQIRQQALPPNHPDMAMSFAYIGNVYSSMGEHARALPYCQRAVDIAQQTMPASHPHCQWYIKLLRDVQMNL